MTAKRKRPQARLFICSSITSRPPPSQTSQVSPNLAVSLPRSRSCPRLKGLPLPILPLLTPSAKTRSHINTPSNLNPNRCAVRVDASFTEFVCHTTRLIPRPPSSGGSRMYSHIRPMPLEATCVPRKAGSMTTVPISIWELAADALVYDMMPARAPSSSPSLGGFVRSITAYVKLAGLGAIHWPMKRSVKSEAVGYGPRV